MWRMRLDFFALREGASEEDDWATFSAYFDEDRRIAVMLVDAVETVLGFTLFSKNLVEHQGRRGLLVTIEYTYIRPEFRGNPMTVTATAKVVLRWMVQRPWVPACFVAFTFPNSFAFINATMGTVWTPQHEDIPSWELDAVEAFGALAAGSKWDSAQKVAWYNNHQPPASPRLDAMPKHIRELHLLYDRLNPRWQEGAAMPIIAPITIHSMMKMARRAGRRAARKWLKRV